MKKRICLAITFIFLFSILSATDLIVRVTSNVEATGTVYVSDQSWGSWLDDTGWDSSAFPEGVSDHTLTVGSQYNPANLWAWAVGGTGYGAWVEIDAVQGFTLTEIDEDVFIWLLEIEFIFPLPYDFTVSAYSNIDISNVNVELKNSIETFSTQTVNLKKGWNDIDFDDEYYSGMMISECYAEVNAMNVGLEELSINSTNNFVQNPNSGRWENSDIELCFENKPLNSDYNWESFPKLNANTNNNNATLNFIGELLTHVEPSYSTYYEVIGRDLNMKFENGGWSIGFYPLQSTHGIKLKLDTANGTKYYKAHGSIVLPTTEVNLQAGWNWIGYWLPNSQMADVAFGSDWDKVKYMKSEDWYYVKQNNIRGGMTPVSTSPRALHYGEGYMVYITEAITSFAYQSTAAKSKTTSKPRPTNFTFQVKADYEVIDLVELDPAISEIGVFAGDVCLGAVVVENSSEQILVYSESANRDQTPFHFEVIAGRGRAEEVSNYTVLDMNSGIFEDEIIIAGKNEYTVVKLGVKVEEEDLTPGLNRLHGNYPNPFNPSTKISFSINETTKIELDIFNTKGQKVKTLYSGSIEAGEHTIEWNGKDNNNKPVSSGIYLYRLKDSNLESTRKMILMK